MSLGLKGLKWPSMLLFSTGFYELKLISTERHGKRITAQVASEG